MDAPAGHASRAAAAALGGSDVALIVVDGARRVDGEAVGVLDRAVAACASAGALPLLVVTKADLLVGASGPATREPGYANDWDVEHSGGGGGAGRGVTWAGRGRGRGGGGRAAGPAGSRQDGGQGLAALHSRIDDLSDALEQSMMEWGLLDARGLDALPVPHVHVVSGRTGGGLGFLRRSLCRLAVPRQWSFARDAVTDLTGPELAEEVIREKIFRSTQAEVPYRVGVEVVSWAEAEAGSLVVVHADIVVPSRAYSAMLTGRGGSALRAIARGAERDLGRTMGRRVRILLHVGVSPSRAQRLMVSR
ncbi:hypothetical protein FNF31_05769 [Cafeteria roenbergensis]|uniref:KH type-2 domain-containing protein n=1 Tax=Cafeteria roenbergensis TaxID=33653 RepID=A0A5A8DFY5_CAFRO|nr:hypothetical protein FNF31_05769 [Cafeteria roenbergensis]KAA0163537.1 hypothetical protein FNF28_04194 [Cafeteria roenbergensis]